MGSQGPMFSGGEPGTPHPPEFCQPLAALVSKIRQWLPCHGLRAPGPGCPRAAPLGVTSRWGPLGLAFAPISACLQGGGAWAKGGNTRVSEGMAGLAREGHGG